MSDNNQVRRPLKDEEYRQALSETEKEALPEHPAGATELSDEQLCDIDAAGVGLRCSHQVPIGRT